MSGSGNRRAVVGGAGSGLGRASAEALAKAGMDLLLWSRGRDALEQAAAELRTAHGVTVHVFTADATDPTTAEAVSAAAEELLGGVDVCVLNAGGPPPCPPDQTNAAEWQRTFQLLAITPIDLATRLLPGMRTRGFGRLVAILSSGVREPLPELCYSNSGRSALTAWLKTVAGTVAADGVTVNGVLPGRVATPRVASLDNGRAQRLGIEVDDVRKQSEAGIPMHRYGTPDEFAAVVNFLASDAASYVTGSFLSCDGGMARSTL
ncbi:MAG TPA: SDR family oxidoreductase [Pseudonocardiaceae bacterium]|nr:SDR family oxidoreductase [Pseudonocardiaceae bacterium]